MSAENLASGVNSFADLHPAGPEMIPDEEEIAIFCGHYSVWERVLIQPEATGDEDFQKGESGLFVTAKSLPVGTIVSPDNLAGRRVLYRKYHGDHVVIDGEHYVIIDPEYILLLIPDGAKVEEVENG